MEDIIHLLSFSLKTTQFAYDGTYYQQAFGTAMGLPVSVANMVMKHMEQRATSPVRPFFWKRYVDDVISVVSGNEAKRLLSHLNPEGPSIQFHLQSKRIEICPFLIQKCADGTRGIRDKCVS